jgi:serine/threonine protein phosphatase PrpC
LVLGYPLNSGDLLFKHPDFTKGKPSGLTAEPDVVDVALEKTDQFIILACDGTARLTHVFSSIPPCVALRT